MNVKEIIKLACTYLQLNDLFETNVLGGVKIPTDYQNKQIDLLLQCVNLTSSVIASDYIKLYKTKMFKTEDGILQYSQIGPEIINQIHSVKNKTGDILVFKTFADNIKTAKGDIFVNYSYLPEPVLLSDSIADFNIKISPRVFAYGVASEYSFIKSVYDDASIWENRFKTALMMAGTKKSGIKIAPRRWL